MLKKRKTRVAWRVCVREVMKSSVHLRGRLGGLRLGWVGLVGEGEGWGEGLTGYCICGRIFVGGRVWRRPCCLCLRGRSTWLGMSAQ